MVWMQPAVEKLGYQGHHGYMVRIYMVSATDWEWVLSTTLRDVVDADQGLPIKQTPSLEPIGGVYMTPVLKGTLVIPIKIHL